MAGWIKAGSCWSPAPACMEELQQWWQQKPIVRKDGTNREAAIHSGSESSWLHLIVLAPLPSLAVCSPWPLGTVPCQLSCLPICSLQCLSWWYPLLSTPDLLGASNRTDLAPFLLPLTPSLLTTLPCYLWLFLFCI